MYIASQTKAAVNGQTRETKKQKNKIIPKNIHAQPVSEKQLRFHLSQLTIDISPSQVQSHRLLITSVNSKNSQSLGLIILRIIL